jgi:hypothetical protein
VSYAAGRRWAIARTAHGRDPARYLGELPHLPAAEQLEPGEWCDLIVRAERQTTKWTLVILDGDATSRSTSAESASVAS